MRGCHACCNFRRAIRSVPQNLMVVDSFGPGCVVPSPTPQRCQRPTVFFFNFFQGNNDERN